MTWGSGEAIVQAMEKIKSDEVEVRVVHSGVGAITESDITLALSSNSIIIGFNVRANTAARESGSQKKIDIRYYSVIYDLVDDITKAAEGLLSPEVRETFIGYAKIQGSLQNNWCWKDRWLLSDRRTRKKGCWCSSLKGRCGYSYRKTKNTKKI